MYKGLDGEAEGSIEGEIIEVGDEHLGTVLAELDVLESYYGPSDPRNYYERESVAVLDKATQEIKSCEAYFCLQKTEGIPVQGADHALFIVEGRVSLSCSYNSSLSLCFAVCLSLPPSLPLFIPGPHYHHLSVQRPSFLTPSRTAVFQATRLVGVPTCPRRGVRVPGKIGRTSDGRGNWKLIST
jgi:hypothetical protein